MQIALNSSVFVKVTLAIKQTMNVETAGLSLSTHLVNDLALGRFGRLRLAVCLEELFDIELQNNAVEQFDTLGDIVDYLSYRYFRDIESTVLTVAA